jgi:hypothetical protein
MRFHFFLLGWSWWRSDDTGARGKVLNPQDTSPLLATPEEQTSPPAYDPRCSCCRLHIPHSQAVHVICSTPWNGQRQKVKAAPPRTAPQPNRLLVPRPSAGPRLAPLREETV